jgi:hypothetical protein
MISRQSGLKAFPAEVKFFQAINNPDFTAGQHRQSIQSCAGRRHEMDETAARFTVAVPDIQCENI